VTIQPLRDFAVAVIFTARGSDGSIVFSISSVNTRTHEPLHLAWWHFARTCTSATSRSLLNFKVIGQRSRSHVLVCAWYCSYPRAVLSLEQGLTVLLILNLQTIILQYTVYDYESTHAHAGTRRQLRTTALVMLL